MKYWQWLFKGTTGEPGIKRFYNKATLGHLGVGLLLAAIVPVSIDKAADTIVPALSTVFVGFVIVWVNMQRLLQSEKVTALSQAHPGLYEKYVFVYQTALLLFLGTLCFWIIGDLRVFDIFMPLEPLYFIIEVALFFSVSLTTRECWHLVLGTAKLVLLNTQKD